MMSTTIVFLFGGGVVVIASERVSAYCMQSVNRLMHLGSVVVHVMLILRPPDAVMCHTVYGRSYSVPSSFCSGRCR